MLMSLVKVEKDHKKKIKLFTGHSLGMVIINPVSPLRLPKPGADPLIHCFTPPVFSLLGGWREELEAQKAELTGQDKKNLLETAKRQENNQ